MPELPEVETIRRSLEPLLTGRTITGVTVFHPDVALPNPQALITLLPGCQILGLGRRGKYLLIQLSGGFELVIHLRMTGKLIWTPDPESPRPSHTHLQLELDQGPLLRYQDVRRFGRLWLLSSEEKKQIRGLSTLGPEPIDPEFGPKMLRKQLEKKAGSPLKSALLDQQVLAGLGNIYVDEALHLARLHPRRLCASLTQREMSRLAQATRKVLEESILRRGTSFRDYADGLDQKGENQDYLQVYQRHGQPCPCCGRPIVRDRIGGRSSFYCPHCQPEKKPH